MSTDGTGEPVAPTPGPDVLALLEQIEQSLLGGPRQLTRADVAAAAETPPDEARRLWRELGFAVVGDDEIVFTDADVAALRDVRLLAEQGFADDELRHAMARMLGQTYARLAASQGQLIIDMIGARPDLIASPETATRTIDELTPVMERVQSYVWRRQLVAYFTRIASLAATEAVVGTTVPMIVGFADMSGFTTLTRRATEAGLSELLEAFEATTTAIVGAHGGRIVKTIGDEILFVADDPGAAAELALELHRAGEDDELLPQLRVGLAAGPVVTRLGDVYGSTVNIASRLTSLCRPGWILVDRELAGQLREDDRFVLKARRPESVRGFHHLRHWRLLAAEDARPRGRRSSA